MQKIIWFMKGYSNLYRAMLDIRKDDIKQEFKILCSHSKDVFVGFQSAHFIEIEPATDCSDEEYLNFCQKILSQYKVDVVFASNRLKLLDSNKKLFEENGCELVIAASGDMIESIDNKNNLYKLLNNQSIVKIPDYQSFNDEKSFKKAYKFLRSNHKVICMKPTEGVYGLGFYKLEDENNHLKRIFDQTQHISVKTFSTAIKKQTFKEMILMQYLEGEERSVDCLAYNGKLVGGITRRKIAGLGMPQEIEDNSILLDQVKWLVEKLKLNGLFNVQFKDTNGEHYLLEINLRMSGRSYYATLGGLNLPYVACQLFSKMRLSEEITYKVNSGLKLHAVHEAIILNNDNI